MARYNGSLIHVSLKITDKPLLNKKWQSYVKLSIKRVTVQHSHNEVFCVWGLMCDQEAVHRHSVSWHVMSLCCCHSRRLATLRRMSLMPSFSSFCLVQTRLRQASLYAMILSNQHIHGLPLAPSARPFIVCCQCWRVAVSLQSRRFEVM